jgi:hypothetical protein
VKAIRNLVIVIVLAATAVLATQFFDGRPAHAAPERPLASASAAGLAMDSGVVQLASVGRISTVERQALQQAANLPGVGRMARPGQAAPTNGGTVQSVCRYVGQAVSVAGTGGVTGVISAVTGSDPWGSGTIANICTKVVETVLGFVGNLLKGVMNFVGNMVASAYRWMFQVSIDLATGYNDRCQVKTAGGGTTLNTAPDAKCTGDEARNRVIAVAGTPTYAAILKLSLLLCFPVLLAAVITSMFKQSFADMGKALVRLPFVWIISVVAIFLVAVAVGLRDAMGNYLIASTDLKGNIDTFFQSIGQNPLGLAMLGGPGVGTGLIMVISFIIAFFGALMLFLIFLVSDMVIFASVAFMPLATIGILWGGTAKWFKRIVELMGAFIIGQVVVIARLCLSFGMIGQGVTPG